MDPSFCKSFLLSLFVALVNEAFKNAFTNACQYNGHSTILVPKKTFLVNSAVFKGPCKGPIVFDLRGTVKAPAGPVNKGNWISFQYMDRLTVTGGGTFDGQGETAWRYNDCHKNPNCQSFPVSIRLDFLNNSVVRGITSADGKNFHMNIFACTNLKIERVRLIAPAESPSVDGIHIGNSDGIRISDSNIATGDDCISFGPGSKNIQVVRVRCGPGHGISIGSVGGSPNELDVTGITVKSCRFDGTDNGLRIKTWATLHKLKVHNISYDDVVLNDVRNPILIDQQYCPRGNCDKLKASSVQIQDVVYNNIRGTSKTRSAVTLKCSRQYPCKNINLRNIDLYYNGPEGQANVTCSNVKGSASGMQKPSLSGCFKN